MKQQTIQITVKKEYLELVPRPTPEDYKILKNSIREDGQHLPIIINQNGVVLDGHTRLQACTELKIQPKYEIKEFDNEYDEKRFVIITNLSRRHLTLFQKAELAFNWYLSEKSTRYQRSLKHIWMVRRGKKYKKRERLLNRLAKLLGTTPTHAHYLTYLIQYADENLKERLRKGTIKLQTAYKIVKQPGWLNDRAKYYGKYDYYRYAKCPRCKAKVLLVEKTGCHVHTKQCCTKCGWGT